MRLQASASRDDELGRWTVAAEYRTAARTTGAGWSANLLADGRLAVLVTEAQAHGVAAALATAALTGAFAAATTGTAPVDLDDLLTSLRASSEGVVRGGEPVAAFLAILDPVAQTDRVGLRGPPRRRGRGAVARAAGASLGGGGARLGASLTVARRAARPRSMPDALLVDRVDGGPRRRRGALVPRAARAGGRPARASPRCSSSRRTAPARRTRTCSRSWSASARIAAASPPCPGADRGTLSREEGPCRKPRSARSARYSASCAGRGASRRGCGSRAPRWCS